jgi:hypothetical protein
MAKTKPHSGACNYEQAKRGNFEVCTRTGCKERFPCAGNDCGHLDCIEERGELPKCHYCGKRVEGRPAGICSPSSTFEPITKSDDNGTWTPWSVRGLNRAVHYSCRSQNASPEERARWGDSL